MAKKRRQDSLYGAIDDALDFGAEIGWGEDLAFVSDLERVEAQIQKVLRTEPALAIELYETFIAGCMEKADEVDDSDGFFGDFAGSLFNGWIRARQAAGADPDETARLLLAWMEADPYCFFEASAFDAVKVLDKAGLKAFEQQVRTRFAQGAVRNASSEQNESDYQLYCSGDILKEIYVKQRNVQKYIDLASAAGVTPADCEAIATMLQARGKLTEAIEWVERGLKIERSGSGQGWHAHKLASVRRTLLVKLGRRGEAVDSAWTEFRKDPCVLTYQELIRHVPKAERGEWREKAMAAVERCNLRSQIQLLLHARETSRLAARIERATNRQLEGLSHFDTEPAANRLSRTHPAAAAKVFRALGMRIVETGKSQYYYEAFQNLRKARDCYRRAGLDAKWQSLVADIRRRHSRKTSVMSGIERLATERQR